MSAQPLLQNPLLDRDLGSELTDFRIWECEVPGAPAESGRTIAPLHRHRSEDEAWYVLRGRLRFRAGAEEFDIPAGAGFLLPRGIAHTFWNPSENPARYLIIAGPKTAALLKELREPRSAPPVPTRELYARFDAELLE